MLRPERLLIDGPDGEIEVFAEPCPEAQGIALIAHPHPLHGGSADNKVVTALARAFRDLGCHALRPNFRGVGASEGAHDGGQAETGDLLAVHGYARARFGTDLPVYLAGFSFGAFVAGNLAQRLAEAGTPARRLALVGTAAGFVDGSRSYAASGIPPDTLAIHGAEDTTVPLAHALRWAESLDLVVQVVPGADHFFHRKLHLIRRIVVDAWKPRGP
jgi:alpha/beta superfamily hydrolase